MNIEKAEKAASDFLAALGIETEKSELKKTPKRVAKTYAKLFDGIGKDTKNIWGETFFGGNSLVAVKNLPYLSVCEHHLLPFFGNVNVAYLPRDGKIAGFSKFQKLIEILSHRPQLQEKFTNEIAQAVYEDLSARGVLVTVTARQLCMAAEEISALEANAVTSVLKGEFADNETLAKEAWRLIGVENE